MKLFCHRAIGLEANVVKGFFFLFLALAAILII